MNKFLVIIIYFLIGCLVCAVSTMYILDDVIDITSVNNLSFLKCSSILSGVIFEELIFRFFLLAVFFKVFQNIFIAILIQALLFAALHVHSYENINAFIGYFIAGHYYCYYLFLQNVKKNVIFYLSFSIGIHFFWNLMQFTFRFFPDEFFFECSTKSIKIRLLMFLALLVHFFLNYKVTRINFQDII